MSSQKGMTIVELLVALAVLLIVAGAATAAYLKLLRGYKSQHKISQSYMANLTGLELLRYDVEMAGFGLPASLTAGASYTEAVAGGPTPYNPFALNDATVNTPRPVVSLNNTGPGGSDVLAIKSAVANINAVSKKWSMIRLVGATPQVKAWGGASLDAAMDFTTGDRFIVLDNDGGLQPPVAGAWACPLFNGAAPAAGYYANAAAIGAPSPQTVYFMYGLDASAGVHRMPFNRVDYYLERINGQIPSSCSPNSYTLYRSTINQADGLKSPAPLVDCVRDFQVAFGLDTSATPDQTVDTWRTALVDGVGNALTAAQIKTQLRELRVFILYHEGGGDVASGTGFRFSGTLNLGDPDIANGLDPGNYPAPPNNFQALSAAALAGAPQLSSFTPAGVDAQYRWKILELAIKPMNLR